KISAWATRSVAARTGWVASLASISRLSASSGARQGEVAGAAAGGGASEAGFSCGGASDAGVAAGGALFGRRGRGARPGVGTGGIDSSTLGSSSPSVMLVERWSPSWGIAVSFSADRGDDGAWPRARLESKRTLGRRPGRVISVEAEHPPV